MHTGEHILYKSIETFLPEITLEKIHLGEQESSLFIHAERLDWDILLDVEQLANKIIKDNLPITMEEYSKSDAGNIIGLRIKSEKIKSEKVRVVTIQGFDNSACTGIHLPFTGMVEKPGNNPFRPGPRLLGDKIQDRRLLIHL
jgi:alanyl-tRNA synthetase